MFDKVHFTIFFYLTIISLTGISCHKKGDENVNSNHGTSDYQLKENPPEGTEVEDRDNILESISSKGTIYSKEVADLFETPLLPRGSAIITSSGRLAHSGITAIIHAATGSLTKSGGDFEPILESVNASIANSLWLARKRGYYRVAIPFIGGNNFAQRIGTDLRSLAEFVIRSALQHRQNLELVFVDYSSNFSPSDFNHAYHTVIQETKTQKDLSFIKIVHGDIT